MPVYKGVNGASSRREKGAGERRRSTLADVATEAGVSRTTVSYVLSERPDARVPDATRRRILDAAERIGYRKNALAAAFRSGRLNTIGIVAPFSLASHTESFGGVYYKDLTLALAAAGFQAGLNPLLLSEDRSRALSLQDLTDRRTDAVILVVKENASEFVTAAEDAGIPCVVIGRAVGSWQVHTDNALGARLAVEHLWGLGHRRVAHFWYGHYNVVSARERRDAFHAEMEARGARPDEHPEFTDKPDGVAGLTDALRRPDGPTALFCYNDELGVRFLDIARDAGIAVPEAASVVSFDDNILAVLARPALTSVHNPLALIATRAVEMVQAQLRGEEPPPGPVHIAPTLTIRHSTGPPRPRETGG